MLRQDNLKHNGNGYAPLECESGGYEARSRHAARNARPAPNSLSVTANRNSCNAVIHNILGFVSLNPEEIQELKTTFRAELVFNKDYNIITEGQKIEHVWIVVDGLACRYKILENGRRQILGFMIPGDFCNVQFVQQNVYDHNVALLSDSRLIKVPVQRIMALIENNPKISRALSLSVLVEHATLREWLLNVGQRNAIERISHLFCEMRDRYHAIGLMDASGSFPLLLNQTAIADTTGLTPVHVNRTLQRMRDMGMIELCQRRLTILDHSRLTATAGFNGKYLRANRSAIPGLGEVAYSSPFASYVA